MSEFTLENIVEQWKILNNSSDISAKKRADSFLTKFKESEKALEISLELYDKGDVDSKIFSVIVIYQFIKSNLSKVLESEEAFKQTKNALLSRIKTAYELNNSIMKEKISCALSVIFLCEMEKNNSTGIEELIDFSSQSIQNSYITINIMINFMTEYEALPFKSKSLFAIKNNIVQKTPLVSNYLQNLLQNLKSNNSEFYHEIYEQVVILIKNWVQFEFNILVLPEFLTEFLNNIDENVCELLSESIQYSKSAKIQIDLTNDSSNAITYCVDHCNKTELKSLFEIIDKVYEAISKASEKEVYANLISSIIENYVFVLFLKDAHSQKVLELLFFFISYRKRNISFKFFNVVSTISSFINTEYNFCNFNDAEKIEFSNYLLKLLQAVINNSQYPKLVEENINNEVCEEDISIEDYRKYTEDFYFDIFNIFAQNFKDDGVQYFVNFCKKIVTDNESSEHLLEICESVIDTLKGVVDIFESMKLNVQPLIEFISMILSNTKMISNKLFFKKFLLFLSQCFLIIPLNESLYKSVMNLLISNLEESDLTLVISSTLLSISEGTENFNQEIFTNLCAVYYNKYDLFDIPVISNIAETLCKLLNKINEEEHINILVKIASPATERIEALTKVLNSDPKKIRYEILKNYGVHERILKNAFFTDNNNIVLKVYEYYLNTTLSYTEIIFNSVVNDQESITAISRIFIKTVKNVQGISKINNLFGDRIITMMINAYNGNKGNYVVFFVIKNVFGNLLVDEEISNEKKESIIESFYNLSRIISESLVSSSNYQIETLDIFAQFFTEVFAKIPKEKQSNTTVLSDTISLFLEAIKSIIENNLINNVLKALVCFIKHGSDELIKLKIESLISTLWSSLDHFSNTTVNQLTILLCECVKWSNDTLKLFAQCIENLHLFNNEQTMIICKYISVFSKNEKKVKAIVNDIVCISKGMGQADVLELYELEIAKLEINTSTQ